MRSLLRLALVTSLIAGAVGIAGADVRLEGTTLQRWDFAGDAEGWLPTHSLAPFRVADGILAMRGAGPDPYAFCAEEKAFDIQASDRQYITIRASVNHSGSAEFFWASSPTGQDAGFRGGDEIRFHMVADGEFHTYIVFPMWKDRVTRIRFDPPDLPGIEVRVDFIAIMQLADSPAPSRPVWTFDQDLEGFVPRYDVSEFSVADGLLSVAGLAGRSPALVSPVFAIPAQQAKYLQLRLSARNVRSIAVRFATDQDPEFNYARSFTVRPQADGAMRTYLVPTDEIEGWTGEITRLEVDLIASGGEPHAQVDTIALAPTPVGPPQALIARFGLPGAVLYLGEQQQVPVAIQNGGGGALEELEVTLSGEALAAGLSAAPDGALAPGDKREFTFLFTPTTAGRQPLSLRVTAGNAAPVERTAETLVSAPITGGEWIRHTGAYADRVGDALWLVNEKIAAVFVRNTFGYGPVSLRVLDHDGWRQIGLLPNLGELVTAHGDEIVTTPFHPEDGKVVLGDGEKAVVEFRGRVAAPGAAGAVRLTFVLRKGSDLIETSLTFTPNRKGEILALRLPRVLAGEGAFGADLRHGLFGGLEYLVGGEHSSSTLDIAPPGNLRFAPHPNRVTLPAMAVASPGGDLVGLIWDPMQRWDGRRTRPTAVFASPNFLDDQPNHLMALFAPSVPEWVDENALLAFRPYTVAPGRPLRLKAAIALARDAGVLRIARLWYAHFAMPDLPPMPRTYRQALALSVRAYHETVSVPGRGWWPHSNAAPRRAPRVALHYVLSEMLLGPDSPVPNARDVALDRMVGEADLHLAVHLGHLLRALHRTRAAAHDIMARQDAAGGWTFQPDEKHRLLGRPGDTTVGTVASGIARLLAAGRLLGDPTLIEAGEKGLAFMDRFTVPRGAQTWEVPLHTPDVLASAHAVDAYLAGYLATGKERYLRRAVYWAETGIPFFYTWQAPEEGIEAMKFGTIPVFGATWYTGSWFGRIVQWCGLAYARSIRHLAPHDQSFDWARLAEGITVSGMVQQRLEPKYLGLYPDSISMLDATVSWGLMLSPRLIADNIFSLLGLPPDAAVETTTLAGRRVTVISARELSHVTAEDATLSFRVTYPAGLSSQAAVIGVAEPTAVLVNDESLPAADDLESTATGFTYDAILGAVVIKLRHGATPASVLVEGLQPAPDRADLTRWDFETTLGGWAAASDLAPLERVDGRLRARITGDDPFMIVAGLRLEAADYRRVRIRMKSPVSGDAQLFFAAGGRPIHADAGTTFEVAADGQFHDYQVDLASVPGWTGVVTSLRIDPVGRVGDVAEIALIEFLP